MRVVTPARQKPLIKRTYHYCSYTALPPTLLIAWAYSWLVAQTAIRPTAWECAARVHGFACLEPDLDSESRVEIRWERSPQKLPERYRKKIFPTFLQVLDFISGCESPTGRQRRLL